MSLTLIELEALPQWPSSSKIVEGVNWTCTRHRTATLKHHLNYNELLRLSTITIIILCTISSLFDYRLYCTPVHSAFIFLHFTLNNFVQPWQIWRNWDLCTFTVINYITLPLNNTLQFIKFIQFIRRKNVYLKILF